MLYNEAAIQEEIRNFYTSLIVIDASKLQGIDLEVVRQRNQLNAHKPDSLIRPVTNPEIDVALKGIDINKAPGIDGLNSLFFEIMEVIKEGVNDAVMELF